MDCGPQGFFINTYIMLYSNKFLKCLQEDLNAFKTPKVKPYQRLGTRGLNRQKMNQVPDYARGRGDLNSKVEQMRRGQATSVVLSPSDVAYVRNRYNIHDIDNGKNLGTTGIKIVQHAPGVFKLIK